MGNGQDVRAAFRAAQAMEWLIAIAQETPVAGLLARSFVIAAHKFIQRILVQLGSRRQQERPDQGSSNGRIDDPEFFTETSSIDQVIRELQHGERRSARRPEYSRFDYVELFGIHV